MRKFLAIMLLAGCAGAVAPVPQSVRLTAEMLTVVMSDASTCRAAWAAAGGAGQICGYDYRVTVAQNPNPLRKLTEALMLALGAGTVQPPMAEVVLTDAAGHASRFSFPPPVPLD